MEEKEQGNGMISIDHLTKRFGKFTAVNDISFDVKQGEVFALLGPNGSGKTTTMKSVVGLSIPTAGRILVNGIDIHRNPKEARSLVSYLPQRVTFPDNLTAREVIRFYASMRKLSKGIADEALAKGNFNGWSDKIVGEFSGGMVQRLGLAIVAMPQAPVLLLDEPTANLDPQGVKRFREFVLEQKNQGKTVVFSTHLLAEAEQLADRVAIFVHGRLVAQESIGHLKESFLATGTIEDLYLHYVGMNSHEEHHS
jgi:Cu-processing system ATP-binding protein